MHPRGGGETKLKNYITELKKMKKLSEQQFEFSSNVAKLIEYIYSQGNKGIGIKNSLHCQRLAIDLNLFDAQGKYCPDTPSYEPFGKYWESLHPLNRWGGNFKHPNVDGNHFEQQLAK